MNQKGNAFVGFLIGLGILILPLVMYIAFIEYNNIIPHPNNSNINELGTKPLLD